MSEQKTQEVVQRGVLAPNRRKSQSSSDEDEDIKKIEDKEEEEDNQPRKNRVVQHQQIPRKPKLVERERIQQPRKEHHDKWGSSRNELPRTKQNSRVEHIEYRKQYQVKRLDDRRNQDNYNRNHQKSFRNDKKSNQSDYFIQKIYQEHQLYTNVIQIGSKPIDRYIQNIEQLLNNHSFVQLRALESKIGKAFLVAQMICSKLKGLDRINIPGSEEVEEIWHPKREGMKKFTKYKQIPKIYIQLSYGNLTTKHIGYQTYKTYINQDYQRDRRRRTKINNE